MRTAAQTILRSEGAAHADVSILLTDDVALREMNRVYRRLDRTTDVLSFAQRDNAPNASPVPRSSTRNELLGDVVISVETAAYQAQQHGLPLEEELALLAVHGILHLLGYDDSTEDDAEEMRIRERSALQT